MLTVDTEIASSRDEVAEMPRQCNRRGLVANMSESGRASGHMRHQRGALTLGLAMGSEGISSTCTSRKRRLARLTMYSHRASAAEPLAPLKPAPQRKCGFKRACAGEASWGLSRDALCSARASAWSNPQPDNANPQPPNTPCSRERCC